MRRVLINLVVIILVAVTIFASRDELKIFYAKAKNFLSNVEEKYNNGAVKLSELSLSKEHEKDRETITPGPLVREEDGSEVAGNLTAAGIIKETNIHRKAAGLAELTVNAKLNASAMRKTNDMLARQYFEHESPTGESIDDLAEDAGYDYIVVGENLAYGNFKDDNDVVTAWMDSPGHRANILNTRYTEIGIGVAKGTYQGREVYMAVQHFGLPISECPAVDAKLKAYISSEEIRLDKELQDLEARRKEIEAMESTNPTYQDKVEEYNAAVGKYNADAKNLRAKIEEYNAGVRKYNECLEG